MIQSILKVMSLIEEVCNFFAVPAFLEAKSKQRADYDSKKKAL